MSSPVPYKYILSLPERVIRSLGALSGGLLREIGSVALPPGIPRAAAALERETKVIEAASAALEDTGKK